MTFLYFAIAVIAFMMAWNFWKHVTTVANAPNVVAFTLAVLLGVSASFMAAPGLETYVRGDTVQE